MNPALVGRGLNPEDRAILQYVVRWLPFGELPIDEAFVEFGLTAESFVRRLRDIIEQHRRYIHPRTVDALIDLCERITVTPARWTPGVSGA